MPLPTDSFPVSDGVLGDLLSRFHDDDRRGRRDSLTHYLAAFPDHTEMVRREYAALFGAPDGPPAGDSDRLGPYQLERRLGGGAEGEVFAGIDTRTGERVAIKRLRAHHAGDPWRRRRFAEQVELGGRFDHPDLCRVLAHDLAHAQPYVVLELVTGHTLFAALHADAQPPPPERRHARRPWARYVVRLALAVQALHAVAVAHLDLKPANVMVTPDGAPRVLDFGLARDLRSHGQERTLPEGTREYMAPEQWLRPQHVDRRADVFALGVLTIECCTGRRPFPSANQELRLQAIRRGWTPAASDQLPAGWPIVLARAVAACPDARQECAAEFAAGLLPGLDAE